MIKGSWEHVPPPPQEGLKLPNGKSHNNSNYEKQKP